MVLVTTSYPDFSAGEISPKLYGRFDLAAFFNGGRRVENFITQVTGPAFFRTGTVFASQTKNNNPAFMYIFALTDALSFVLEFTDQTLRFYRNNGIVLSGGVPYEVSTPYLTSQLFQLKFAQNGTDLYITHPSHNPKKLTYTSPTSWALANHSPVGLTLSSNEYPSAVTFFEQRLVYGGSNNKPQTLFFSKSGDVNTFTIGTAVDDGIAYTVSGDGNTIKWLRGTSKFLAIGTFGDVLQATGGIDGVITPTSISVKPTNSFGVADINPIGKGSQVFFAQRNKLILRSFEYDLQQDGYIPVDRNTIADHITRSGITQIAYQEGRPNIVWCAKNNGELIGMTIEDAESVSGWHRHSTDGTVISIISTPRQNDYNQLWLCVKRNVDGVDNYYVEYLSDPALLPRREDYVDNTKAQDDTIFANLMFESQKQYIYADASLSYYGDYSANTMKPTAVSGTTTFTASGATFASTDIGKEIWRKSVTGYETGRARITGYTSSTVVTCLILETFDSTNTIPAGQWYLTSNTFSGLTHLEGKTVSVISDGGQHTPQTVSNGQIMLDRQSSVVHVGLGYKGYLETTDVEGGGVQGPAQTNRKTIVAFGVRFLDTLYAKIGSSYYNLNQIEMRTASMRMDRPPLPLTGSRKVTNVNSVADDAEAGWKRDQRVIICQDQPFPCNIQLIIPYLSVTT